MSLGRLLDERLIQPIRQAQGATDSIARGAALGVWIAMTPTIGAQMVVVAMLAIPLRANIPVAMALVWISNPLTMVPLYFCFYWLGNLIVRQPRLTYGVWEERVGEALPQWIKFDPKRVLASIGTSIPSRPISPIIIKLYLNQ